MSLLIEAGFDRCLWDTSCCPHSHAPCSCLPGPLPPSLCPSCARLPAGPVHGGLSASEPLLVPSANHRPHLCLLFLYLPRSPCLHTVREVALPPPRPSPLLRPHLLYFSLHAITIRPFLVLPLPSMEMHTRGGQAFHLFCSLLHSHHQKPTRCLTILHGSTVAFFPGFQHNEGSKVGTCVHKISRGIKRDRRGGGHLW